MIYGPFSNTFREIDIQEVNESPFLCISILTHSKSIDIQFPDIQSTFDWILSFQWILRSQSLSGYSKIYSEPELRFKRFRLQIMNKAFKKYFTCTTWIKHKIIKMINKQFPEYFEALDYNHNQENYENDFGEYSENNSDKFSENNKGSIIKEKDCSDQNLKAPLEFEIRENSSKSVISQIVVEKFPIPLIYSCKNIKNGPYCLMDYNTFGLTKVKNLCNADENYACLNEKHENDFNKENISVNNQIFPEKILLPLNNVIQKTNSNIYTQDNKLNGIKSRNSRQFCSNSVVLADQSFSNDKSEINNSHQIYIGGDDEFDGKKTSRFQTEGLKEEQKIGIDNENTQRSVIKTEDKNKIKVLESEIGRLNSALEKSSQEKKSQDETIKSLVKQLNESESDKDKIKKIENENLQLMEDNEALKLKLSSSEKAFILKMDEINREKESLKEEIIKINESYQIKIRQNQNIQQDLLKYENEISQLKNRLKHNDASNNFLTNYNEDFQGNKIMIIENKRGEALKRIYLQISKLKNSYLTFRENTMSNLNIQKLTLEDIFVNEKFRNNIEERANEMVLKIQKKYTNLSNERKILLHEIARLKNLVSNQSKNLK